MNVLAFWLALFLWQFVAWWLCNLVLAKVFK